MTLKYEINYHRGDRYSGRKDPHVTLHSNKVVADIAGFAFELIRSTNFIIVGDPDGEDSAGRAKAKEKSAEAIANRAFDIAEAAFAAAEARGHLIEVPSMAEIDERAKETEDKN